MTDRLGKARLVFALLLLAIPAAAAPRPGLVETQDAIAYGPLPAERGDFYRPKGIATVPAVLVIHGGGWVGGSRGPAARFAKLLASQGLAAFNIDYRLASTADPATRWPAQIVDVQLAVRWLRAHAATLHIDPGHIGATGDSAGAHLAVMLGVLHDVLPGEEASLYPGQRPDVQIVVDQFGPVDLPSLPGWIGSLYPALFGTPSPPADAVAAMSPLPSITSASAPVMIVQGDTDSTVPPSQSLRLRDALAARGVPVELVRFPGGHAYEGLAPEALAALQQRMIDFLAAGLRH